MACTKVQRNCKRKVVSRERVRGGCVRGGVATNAVDGVTCGGSLGGGCVGLTLKACRSNYAGVWPDPAGVRA
eukprot:7783278-Pyramimonas_sp.AAC.1